MRPSFAPKYFARKKENEMKHSTLIAALATLVITFPAHAWESGQDLSEVVFENIDDTGNETLDFGESS